MITDFIAFLGRYPILGTLLGLGLVFLTAYLADFIAKRVFVALLARLVHGTPFQFDDVLVRFHVFSRAAHMAPALVLYFGVGLVPGVPVEVDNGVQNAAAALMVLISVSVLAAMLSAGAFLYTQSAKPNRPIEAYIQITKIVLWVVGVVVSIATLTGRSPLLLLSGIGAITAVLLLIFRDTILSFVASLQMSSYDMVRIGDWIEMPQYGADGDVVELSLHTVKVQNWDKTITAIPTYKLIEQSFKNWRGMKESGGRRIKRAFFVDMTTIRFLSEEELDRLERFVIIRDYIREKRRELADYNKAFAADPTLIVNARRLTNLGTLRAYLVGYLRCHPKIRQDMTLMVRQLSPAAEGLPIELYAFSSTTAWVEYEAIQSDIFDHVFSIAGEFGLRVFQAPSGSDFSRLAGSRSIDEPVPDGSRAIKSIKQSHGR